MNAGIVKILQFYSNKGYDIDSILNDIEHDILTENKCRDGRTVYWYMDELTQFCVDETGHELSPEEIENQLT